MPFRTGNACRLSARGPHWWSSSGGVVRFRRYWRLVLELARFCKMERREEGAMAKKTNVNLEFLLVKAELRGIPEKGLLRSRNIGQIDLIWPRTGVAKKSGERV